MSKHREDPSVDVGSWVKIREEGDDEVEVYRIAAQTNVQRNAIAVDNPMGKALLGAKAGDEVTVPGRAGRIKFRVLEVGRD